MEHIARAYKSKEQHEKHFCNYAAIIETRSFICEMFNLIHNVSISAMSSLLQNNTSKEYREKSLYNQFSFYSHTGAIMYLP